MLSRSHAAGAAFPDWSAPLRAGWHAFSGIAVRAARGPSAWREPARADTGLGSGAAFSGPPRFARDGAPRPHRPERGDPRSFREGIGAIWRRHRSRARIAMLDAAMLKDIGVSFAEAEAEANKPFWRL